ncbi:hypothetical protein F5884DRAFT_891516 [Xylogone sp. PMI_703]|nr:hypothetical protein F5884DRAFT_891516 [Xylogone sp. PMI_703]
MAFVSVILYPADPDATFDMSYYLEKHMPLMQEKFTKYGLKEWKVINFTTSLDGSKKYSVGATCMWENGDRIKEAFGSQEGAEVRADLQSFSNKRPLLLMGDFVGGI